MQKYIETIFAALLLVVTMHPQPLSASESNAASSPNPAQHLTNNTCFMQLRDTDKVIVTAAFHSGAEGFTELQQLIDRKPWGEALSSVQREEITTLQKEASPFLIVTLTKKQALILEDHRDLIKWILVQSTTTACVTED
jgi:hypothetical protein